MGLHGTRWQPGTHITVRNIWHGRVFSAFPFVVVEDTADLITTYIPPGTVWKQPTDRVGCAMRLPHGVWELRDAVWYGHGTLRIFVRGAAHSVLVFRTPGTVNRWYINLEEPYQHTAIGLDTRDNYLDVVFPCDLSTPHWKDETELDAAVALGIIDAAEATAIRAEA